MKQLRTSSPTGFVESFASYYLGKIVSYRPRFMTGAISCFSYLSHGLVQKIIGSHKRAVATAAMRVDKSQKENENAENRILDS